LDGREAAAVRGERARGQAVEKHFANELVPEPEPESIRAQEAALAQRLESLGDPVRVDAQHRFDVMWLERWFEHRRRDQNPIRARPLLPALRQDRLGEVFEGVEAAAFATASATKRGLPPVDS
jgi:hypothetical protein